MQGEHARHKKKKKNHQTPHCLCKTAHTIRLPWIKSIDCTLKKRDTVISNKDHTALFKAFASLLPLLCKGIIWTVRPHRSRPAQGTSLIPTRVCLHADYMPVWSWWHSGNKLLTQFPLNDKLCHFDLRLNMRLLTQVISVSLWCCDKTNSMDKSPVITLNLLTRY